MSERNGVDVNRMVMLPEDGPMPKIPDDVYKPVYRHFPVRPSSEDSMARGHWVWSYCLLGYLGQHTGVMLSPEWHDALVWESGTDGIHI